jgi:hypothetical protein
MRAVSEPLGVGTTYGAQWPAQIDDGSRRVTTDESAELKRLKAGKRRTHARQCDADGRLGFLRRRAGPARPPIPQAAESILADILAKWWTVAHRRPRMLNFQGAVD